MSLDEYRRKRDRRKTPEPFGGKATKATAPRFVVQRHDARRLHYDFRLERHGALASWAVPKGVPLRRGERHLAVHVEDHPLEYGDFEGEIPAGQYGAGSVIIWDRGEWAPLGDVDGGLRKGKLDFELRGTKLHGRWTLIRLRKRAGDHATSWLLVKGRDAEARREGEYDI